MKEITQSSFNSDILGRFTVVDFYTTWCTPCKSLKPVLEAIELENQGLNVVSVNIEDSPVLAEQYSISSVPTVVLVDGDRHKKIVGLFSKSFLQKSIDDFFDGSDYGSCESEIEYKKIILPTKKQG